MTLFKFSSSLPKETLSSLETLFSGILAINEITFWMSSSETVFLLLFFRSLNLAPASSTTSMALSGRNLSFMCFEESSTADFNASFEYLSSWCSSNFDFKPSRIFKVSS